MMVVVTNTRVLIPTGVVVTYTNLVMAYTWDVMVTTLAYYLDYKTCNGGCSTRVVISATRVVISTTRLVVMNTRVVIVISWVSYLNYSLH